MATVDDNCGGVEIKQTPAKGIIVNGDTEITLTATDDAGNKSTACSFELILTEESKNMPPQAFPDEYEVVENEVLNIGIGKGVLSNDKDPEKNNLSAELKKNVLHGTLNLNPDGSFRYEPNQNFVGEDSFTYVAFDGINYSSEVKVKITVLENPTYFTCISAHTIYLDENGEANLITDALYETNAENAKVSVDRAIFDCSDLGKEIPVRLEYEYDKVKDFCIIPVTVKDTLAPQIFTKAITVSLKSSGTAAISAGDVDNASTDNCQIINLKVDKWEFNCDDLGENKVILTMTDASGNSSSAEATVIITDPEKICPEPVEPPDKPDEIPFLIIYPNPGEGMVKIATSDNIKLIKVNVFDMRGRFLMTKEFREFPDGDYFVDLRQFQSGAYTLQLFSEEEIFARRAIIRID